MEHTDAPCDLDEVRRYRLGRIRQALTRRDLAGIVLYDQVTLLQAHPDVNIVYAHNDEMAIGAIQALELAGRTPGDDVLVVSIDGTRDALQAIIDGKMGVTVESSPFFGPLACETMNRYANGETIEPWVKVEDRIFTKANAAMHIDSAY